MRNNPLAVFRRLGSVALAILAILFQGFIWAGDYHNLSLETLAQCAEKNDYGVLEPIMQHGAPVYLKGFLYARGPNQWILAAEPGLKTCCVGKGSKVLQQVIVEGNFPDAPADRIVSIKGQLAIEPLYDRQGLLSQLFLLKNAVIDKETRRVPYSAILLGCTILVSAGLFLRRIRS